ncbi:MAG: DUF3616 domain-containing protein [Pseudomonadota bacterium]
MKKLIKRHAVRLEFDQDSLVHLNLSGAAFIGDTLWVAGDEACGIDRLTRLQPTGPEALRFGEPVNFPLADFIDLPGEADDEADLEGMAFDGRCLWVVGSHGLKRKNAKPGRSAQDNARRLAKLSLDSNRLLLACIPVEPGEGGVPTLVPRSGDGRRARRLQGDERSNALTRLLADDPHFGPFLPLPGKDNGFDVEGMALLDESMLLGLRGPVLRGWAGLLELNPRAQGDHLQLAALQGSDALLRKHFLNLGGLGVRDLHMDGDDLYILAGPTMVLDGDIRLYRWAGARQALQANDEPVTFWPDLPVVCTLPHEPGADRAEAFCALPAHLARTPSWLALYDAPAPARHPDEFTVLGDLVARA